MGFSPRKKAFPFKIGPTFWKTPALKICHTPRSGRSVHTGWHGTATCGEIWLKILDQTVISTDSYHPISIKVHVKRSSSEKVILAGPVTWQPHDSEGFVANYDTKKRLCQLLLYGVVNRSLLGWTEQIWQSSLWGAQQFVTADFAKLLVLLLRCLFPLYFVFIMPSVSIIKTKVEVLSTYPLSTTTRNRLIRGWYSEKTTVSLSSAIVSSVERFAPAPSKAKERWGNLGKNFRFHKAVRQKGDDWNVKPCVIRQLEQFT